MMMNIDSDPEASEEQALIPSQHASESDHSDTRLEEEPTLLSQASGENDGTDVLNSGAIGIEETSRSHSYLPGTSHPLFPESLLDRRRRVRSNSYTQRSIGGTPKRFRNDQSDGAQAIEAVRNALTSPCHRSTRSLVELPILELNGVVLFPGSTIPIRLRERHWVEYLGRQIDEARGIRGIGTGSEEARLGILTYVDPRPAREQHLRRQRRSWMRNAISPSQGSQMVMFWREYDRLSRELERSDSGAGRDSESQSQSSIDSTNSTDRRRVNAPRARGVPPSSRASRRSSQRPRQRPLDPWIGRIGTMATITYTHEDAAGASVDAHETHHDPRSLVWQRSEDSQLVVTALGTGRFRIVSRIDGDDDDGSGRRHRNGFEGDMASIRLYQVEELEEEEFSVPPLYLRRSLSSARTDASMCSVPFLLRQEQIIHNMSLLSPLPHFVLRTTWPWRLVGLIMAALDRIPALEGLRKTLVANTKNHPITNSKQSSSPLEPRRFSYWMACNMPLSENEKLELLAMHCTLTRLRFIYEKVLEQEEHETFIYCRNCSQRLGLASSIFTVGGADGTTGAYVNEHGIVHQTVTLRAMDEANVFLEGGPETKDSWFPGYSWTITYCATCRSHLGWKFLRVQANAKEEEDRPDMFWGMSGGATTTETFAGVEV